MTIYIEDLKFQCIVGILDFERTTEQDVIVNIKIEYAFEDAFINYALVVDLVKSSMIQNKFLLLEDALSQLSDFLKKEFSTIDSLYIKITKPSILPNCRVNVSNSYNFNS